MIIKNSKTGLTMGLLAGYGGKTDLAKIERAGFAFVSSHLAENNFVYHDEWLNANVKGACLNSLL